MFLSSWLAKASQLKNDLWLIFLLTGSLGLQACSSSQSNSLMTFSQFSAGVVVAPSADCAKDCVERKKEFKFLVYVAEKIYCYWDEKQAQYQVDFKQKALELESRINNTMTATDYFLLLSQWASVFRDGHVNPMLKDDLSDLDLYAPGIRLEMLAPGTDHETLIVSQVSEDIQKLKVGTVVEKIQGQPWKNYLPLADSLTMGSTEFMRHRQMANLIFRVLLQQEGPRPILVEGTYKGQPVQEVISRSLALYDGAPAGSENETGLKLIKSAILENNIGYLRIDGFSGSKMGELLDQAMGRLQNTKGLLLDVRKNGGGDQSGNVILQHLISQPVVRYKHRSVYADYLLAFRPEILIDFDYLAGKFTEFADRRVRPIAGGSVYKNPVAILTSPNCFSACDTFVSALKENQLATVLGENTGGGTGTPQVIDLPVSGHKFRYSVYQGFTAVSQKMLEGVGTAPDVVIEPTLDERVEKKDRQLESALQWLARQVVTPVPSAQAVIPASLLESESRKDLSMPLEVEMDREIKQSFE